MLLERVNVIDLHNFQRRIAHKFSNTEYAGLVNVILAQPSKMTIEEFIFFSGFLLSFMDTEQHSFNSLKQNNKVVIKRI